MNEKEQPQLSPIQPKPNLLNGLPQYLKEPKNYDKVRKFLFDILASRCGHSDPASWYTCQKCLKRIRQFREALKKLGFRSVPQYYQWRRVHEMMQKQLKGEFKKDPLQKYDD